MSEGTQRRLAAIVSADVAGYSRLMGEDEAGTLAVMRAHRTELWDPTIERYGGRVVGTAGDSILIEFASAVAAVESSISVQEGMAERNADLPADKRMLLRIGINIGEVIVEDDDIFGDGVNVAARLQEIAAPGGLAFSNNVQEQIEGKLDGEFLDDGPHELKNISRPVHVWRWTGSAGENAEPAQVETKSLPLPDKPSIAVLPFQNMSGDAEQEFFADGMSEDIITALSRYRSLFVIARNSTFAYKGQSPDLRDVARDLGVKYVLEGSIRKAGTRIRVSGQLIEGASGSHIWAERYDRELNDIFALQDEVTETIVAAIGPEIDQFEREQAQRLPPDSLDAWESYQRGLWHLFRFNRADNAEAQRLFRLANTHSANFSPALSGLTHALYFSYMHGYANDNAAALAEAYETGRAAVMADERDADAHFALGRILYLRHEHDASISEFETALSHNPSLAPAYLGYGTVMAYSGIWDRAVDILDRGLRLSPHDPLIWVFFTAKALAFLGAKKLEEAAQSGRQAIRQPSAQITAYFILAATLGQLEKTEETQKVMAEVLRIKPDISTEYVARILPFKNSADLDYVVAGLVKAGLPG